MLVIMQAEVGGDRRGCCGDGGDSSFVHFELASGMIFAVL
jgi:hypothetical protein